MQDVERDSEICVKMSQNTCFAQIGITPVVINIESLFSQMLHKYNRATYPESFEVLALTGENWPNFNFQCFGDKKLPKIKFFPNLLKTCSHMQFIMLITNMKLKMAKKNDV